MNYYGQELKLIEENLVQLRLEQISDLTEQTYFQLLKIVPDCIQASAVMSRLYTEGYVKVHDAESYVENIPMSVRLKNILLRSFIFYLPQLSVYPKETIARFRNLGQKGREELYSICSEQGIVIGSMEELKKLLNTRIFDEKLYLSLFCCNIRSFDDFNGMTTSDLYYICFEDYRVTLDVYSSLLKNGATFSKWEDAFLFELLPKKKALMLHLNYEIERVSELLQCQTVMNKTGITGDMIDTMKNSILS